MKIDIFPEADTAAQKAAAIVAALTRLREGDLTIPAGRIQTANALVLADQAAAGPL